jgi:DNA-binding IclR family transcriptional regulator
MPTTVERQAQTDGVAVVERAILVQQLVVAAEAPLSLRELARRAELAPTTTKRLVQTLEGLSLVARDTNGRYVVGTSAGTLAGNPDARTPGPALDIAAKRVVEHFGESATVAVDAGEVALYTGCRVSQHDVQVPDVTGDTSPFHLIASGLVLMTAWPDDRLDRYLASDLVAATETSVTDPKELRARIARTRADGYAWSVGESLADITAVAVPVHGRAGGVLASIGLYGPSFRLDPSDTALATELEQVVSSTTKALGL